MYSIGEISKKFNIPISTLRYYDKEGLLTNIKRNKSGIRQFDDADINTLVIIECLKKSGMCLKDIKQFLDWCNVGDSTIKERRDMFFKRKLDVEKQIEELQKVLDFIKYKCWYYDTAYNDKTEKNVSKLTIDDFPENIKKAYKNSKR